MQYFYRVIRNVRNRHILSPELSLEYTREKVLYRIISVALVLGAIVYIPAFIASIRAKYYDTIVIDTLFYLWLFFLFISKKIDYRQRAFMFVSSVWFLALYLILRFGFQGAGFVWMLVVPVLAGILIGLNAGLMLLGATIVIFIVFPFLIEYYRELYVEGFGLFWAIMSSNVVVLSALLLISSAVMIRILNRVIVTLKDKYDELDITKDITIETVAKLAEFKDTETGAHIERTKTYVKLIAEALSKNPKYSSILTPEYIELLYKTAPLHDIGKIGIPDRILLKKGKLTKEEMEVMKQHTVIGRDALMSSERQIGSNDYLRVAAEIAYTHHEKWDGSGYPLGLKGDKIPLSGRIMAVADVYDALRSKRPYKEPMSHEETIAYLKENAGTHFDPEIIALLPDISDKMNEAFLKHTNNNR